VYERISEMRRNYLWSSKKERARCSNFSSIVGNVTILSPHTHTHTKKKKSFLSLMLWFV